MQVRSLRKGFALADAKALLSPPEMPAQKSCRPSPGQSLDLGSNAMIILADMFKELRPRICGLGMRRTTESVCLDDQPAEVLVKLILHGSFV